MRTVLLADDDVDDTELFCEALQEIYPSIQVLIACNCGELLQKLKRKNEQQPDLIFLDINMPDMNGWDCLEMLKENENYREIPVIIYTTSTSAGDIDKAARMGAKYLFTKPDRYDELKVHLKTMISEYCRV